MARGTVVAQPVAANAGRGESSDDVNIVSKAHARILGKVDRGIFDPVERGVAVRIDKLKQRLYLEDRMAKTCVKLPFFISSLGCFLVAISILVPTERVANVHRRLTDHFGLSRNNLESIRSFGDIYDYAAAFEGANGELQATSAEYWCEKRYFELTWSDALSLPLRGCPSPRLHALGLETDDPTPWAAAQHAPPNRRLSSVAAAGRALSESSDAPASPGVVSPCEDDHALLQAEEGDASITCEADKEHICSIDLGVVACARTCGYCPPFAYEQRYRYDRAMVTPLPAMMHQTRFVEAACATFAEAFEHQPYNHDLKLLPPLDGSRNARVFTCVDRGQQSTADFAFSLECPPTTTPEDVCQGGRLQHTPRHTYLGDSVYAMFLAQPEKDLAVMRAIDWLDVQTRDVVISTLVYTQDVEIFTSVSIRFRVDSAGNVDGRHNMTSYTDITRHRQFVFVAMLITTSVCALLSSVATARDMVRGMKCKRGPQMYELLASLTLFAYSLVLLISSLKQVPMGEEYDDLLHTTLEFKGTGVIEWEALSQQYFDAMALVWDEMQWLLRHRIVTYVVLYVQFLQLLFFFDCHPRLALVTSTINRSLDQMFHLFVLFVLMFLILAFMASWMLGGDVHAFASFGEAMASQAKMLFGEWIYADNADDLHGGMVAMYWCYAISFMLVLFFTILNFFLAIVVEAFKANDEIGSDTIEQNVVVDIVDILASLVTYRRHRWASRAELIAALERAPSGDDGGVWQAARLAEFLPESMRMDAGLPDFLAAYARKCPAAFADTPTREPAQPTQDPLVASLDEAFGRAVALLQPALGAFFYGGMGEGVWSFGEHCEGGARVREVSVSFMRERHSNEGDDSSVGAQILSMSRQPPPDVFVSVRV